MPLKIKFIDGGKEKVVTAKIGQTILDVVNNNTIYLDCICQGCLNCSTCHVVLDEAFFKKTCASSPISLDEKELLLTATGLTKTSRLGCQIKLTAEMEGMVLKIPPKD